MERRRTGRGLPGIAGACTAVLLIAFFYGEMDLYAFEAPLTRVRWLSLGFAALVPLTPAKQGAFLLANLEVVAVEGLHLVEMAGQGGIALPCPALGDVEVTQTVHLHLGRWQRCSHPACRSGWS